MITCLLHVAASSCPGSAPCECVSVWCLLPWPPPPVQPPLLLPPRLPRRAAPRRATATASLASAFAVATRPQPARRAAQSAPSLSAGSLSLGALGTREAAEWVDPSGWSGACLPGAIAFAAVTATAPERKTRYPGRPPLPLMRPEHF